jgi:hypothetical protein
MNKELFVKIVVGVREYDGYFLCKKDYTKRELQRGTRVPHPPTSRADTCLGPTLFIWCIQTDIPVFLGHGSHVSLNISRPTPRSIPSWRSALARYRGCNRRHRPPRPRAARRLPAREPPAASPPASRPPPTSWSPPDSLVAPMDQLAGSPVAAPGSWSPRWTRSAAAPGSWSRPPSPGSTLPGTTRFPPPPWAPGCRPPCPPPGSPADARAPRHLERRGYTAPRPGL